MLPQIQGDLKVYPKMIFPPNSYESMDLSKFVMYTLVSRVHMIFYIQTKGYTVPENQGKLDITKSLPTSTMVSCNLKLYDISPKIVKLIEFFVSEIVMIMEHPVENRDLTLLPTNRDISIDISREEREQGI